jgi:hypothetical protein
MPVQTRFAIKPRQEPWLRSEGLRGLLRCIFWRNLALVDLAERLLKELKERREIPASEWRRLMKKYGVTQSNYSSCLQRLKGAGMIRRESGFYRLSNDFSNWMDESRKIWLDWRVA